MNNLASKKCMACKEGEPPLESARIAELEHDLGGNWQVINEHHLEKEYRFKDFKGALAFANKIGALAESEGHHPNLHISWGGVRVLIWTHSINGLSESDFIFAAKCDQIVL